MLKKLLICFAGVLCIYSCTKNELDSDQQVQQGSLVSVPVSLEGLQTDTKANFYANSTSSWGYNLEDGDDICYFKFSGGRCTDSGFAFANVGENSRFIDFNAAALSNGEYIYSYLRQREFNDALENEESNYNDNPKSVLFSIPEYQKSYFEPTYYSETVDCSFTISNISYSKSSITLRGATTVPSNTLNFKIVGYNPSLDYEYETTPDGYVSNFTIDNQGNAKMTVTFPDITKTSGSSSFNLKVSVSNYPDYENSATLKLTVNKATSGRFTYSCAQPNYVNELAYEFKETEDHNIYLRDAMPYVTKGLKITSYLLSKQKYVGEALTFYILGSAFSLKLYSTNADYCRGEEIKSIRLTTTTPCAGRYSYDITRENLTLTPMAAYASCSVESDFEDLNISVPSTKLSAVPTYMIVAPGTYSGRFEIETTNWIHSFSFSNKALTRAYMFTYTVDLNSSAVTHTRKLEAEPDPASSVNIDNWNESNDNGYEF